MPILLAIISALAALAPQIPEIVTLVQTAADIASTGVATPEQEAQVRALLDQMHAAIDASAPEPSATV
jgi:hypothetical protein